VSGLVALGDSITRDGGEPMLGLPGRPWVNLLAQALGLTCENLARDGATARDVLREQVPALRGPAAVACLYVGVNDARSPDWDAEAFARDLDAILEALTRAAPVVLTATLPEDLGRPTASPKPLAANAIIRSAAAARHAIVVALDDLAGRELVLPDGVHLTALGEVAIASRAARALTGRGIEVPGDVDALARPDRSAPALAAWRARRAQMLAVDLRRRRRERDVSS
jgi:lysophospholipase L1-like esterase